MKLCLNGSHQCIKGFLLNKWVELNIVAAVLLLLQRIIIVPVVFESVSIQNIFALNIHNGSTACGKYLFTSS